MARAFLHRLIAYVFLIYSFAAPTSSSNPFPNPNTLLGSLSPLFFDQTPVHKMAYPQNGYRSVAYFVVSQLTFYTGITMSGRSLLQVMSPSSHTFKYMPILLPSGTIILHAFASVQSTHLRIEPMAALIIEGCCRV